MRFMNEWDIENAVLRHDPGEVPNRAHLAATVDALRDWANGHSDGWHMWPKPARAAARAMALIDGMTLEERDAQLTDATDAETKAALSPIKAFLTRQGVAHDSVIPARQTGIPWRDRPIYDREDPEGVALR